MKFYMTPGSCSIGVHVLLEECELFFQAHIIDLLAGANLSPEFLAINPRGSVPALALNDGNVLTDFESIAVWLADNHPKKNLLPSAGPERERLLQVMRYVIAVLHGEGFTRVFVAERYAKSADAKSSIQHEGRAAVQRGFERLQTMLTGARYVSDTFSVADAAVFYVEFWAVRSGIPLPARAREHFEAMCGRAAVRQVLAEEGYVSTLRQYPASLELR